MQQGLPTDRDVSPFVPPARITELRETRPVSPLLFPDGHEGWLVTGYDAVRQVLADTRFSSRQDLGIVHVPFPTPGMPELTEPVPQEPGVFISMDPPDHTRLRRKLTGAFTVKRMKALEERVAEITEQRLDELAQLTPPVDLVREFALPVPSQVICELLGVPYEDRGSFEENSARFMERDITLEDKIAVYVALSTYLNGLVTSKRAEPADDLLSDLARDEDLSDAELTGMAFLLLLAGHETTANMLALGTFALLEHPDQLAELRSRPELIPDAVEELLRYLSVADVFFRYASQDVELHGETIREGSMVVLSLLGGNHDPERYDDAGVLDVHRNARGHLAFGHGVHQCLGQQLARIEMRAGFEGLLRRFPTLRLDVPARDVELKTMTSIYGVHALPVSWE
ncbi:cytochrome P450 [Lentzea sp. NPDC060358]|uniref:cytochrome P450 n=1 Tax=Lentzea sp. NPDC060358 TaxID=3347103 RepID=UPI003662B488